MTKTEILHTVLSFLTLIVTALVPIMIYWLQKKHEKEIEAIRRNQVEKELINSATAFLIDHEEERDYLPWCTIASSLHRLEHHTRKIYTDFCRCSPELQDTILMQAGFTIRTIKHSEWLDKCICGIQKYIKDNDLGKDWLYDTAKYFHRGFDRYRDTSWENTPRIFEPIEKENYSLLANRKIDIGTYIEEYIWIKSHHKSEETETIIPPIDYVEATQNLGTCDEAELCRWIMEILFYVCIIAHNTSILNSEDILTENNTDAVAYTFEDRYYEILWIAYYTFVAMPVSKNEEETGQVL